MKNVAKKGIQSIKRCIRKTYNRRKEELLKTVTTTIKVVKVHKNRIEVNVNKVNSENRLKLM